MDPPNMQDITTRNRGFALRIEDHQSLHQTKSAFDKTLIFLHMFHLVKLHLLFRFLLVCWERHAWNMFHLKLTLSMLFLSVLLWTVICNRFWPYCTSSWILQRTGMPVHSILEFTFSFKYFRCHDAQFNV